MPDTPQDILAIHNPINPTIAAREAVYALSKMLEIPYKTAPLPPCCITLGLGRPDQRVAGCNLSPHDLARPIEDFTALFIEPCIADLAKRLPPKPLFADALELPVGLMMSAARETFRGVTVRCLITDVPVPKAADPKIWRSFWRTYNINEDDFIWCDVGLVMRFDVLLAE